MNRIATALGMLPKEPTRAVPKPWQRCFHLESFPRIPRPTASEAGATEALPRVEAAKAFPGIESIDVIVPRAYDRVHNVSMDPLETLVLGSLVKFTRAERF